MRHLPVNTFPWHYGGWISSKFQINTYQLGPSPNLCTTNSEYYRFSLDIWEMKDCYVELSHVQLFATPWTVAQQASLSMEFSRQEYCIYIYSYMYISFPDRTEEPGGLQSMGVQRIGHCSVIFTFTYI